MSWTGRSTPRENGGAKHLRPTNATKYRIGHKPAPPPPQKKKQQFLIPVFHEPPKNVGTNKRREGGAGACTRETNTQVCASCARTGDAGRGLGGRGGKMGTGDPAQIPDSTSTNEHQRCPGTGGEGSVHAAAWPTGIFVACSDTIRALFTRGKGGGVAYTGGLSTICGPQKARPQRLPLHNYTENWSTLRVTNCR